MINIKDFLKSKDIEILATVDNIAFYNSINERYGINLNYIIFSKNIPDDIKKIIKEKNNISLTPSTINITNSNIHTVRSADFIKFNKDVKENKNIVLYQVLRNKENFITFRYIYNNEE